MNSFWNDKRKKKSNSFFDDDEFGFGDLSKMMNEIMKQAFRGSMSFKTVGSDKPVVYGFSMKMGSDGQPRFEEFGNVKPRTKQIKREREPLVDVIEKQKEVTVVAELPGVEKKEIDVEVTEDGRSLIIDVPKKFYKEISLPCRVVDKKAEAKYNNGILEVDLEKVKESKPKAKKIKVE